MHNSQTRRRRYSKVTLRTDLCTLRVCLKWAASMGLVDSSVGENMISLIRTRHVRQQLNLKQQNKYSEHLDNFEYATSLAFSIRNSLGYRSPDGYCSGNRSKRLPPGRAACRDSFIYQILISPQKRQHSERERKSPPMGVRHSRRSHLSQSKASIR